MMMVLRLTRLTAKSKPMIQKKSRQKINLKLTKMTKNSKMNRRLKKTKLKMRKKK